MTRKAQPMPIGERLICLTLFVCLAVAVLSTVSLFYLTAIIYIPTQKELEAGYNPEPVVCTAEFAEKVDCGKTDWISCYEWCIADPGGSCTRIWASVRQNGTDVHFSQCRQVLTRKCLTIEDEPASKPFDCKNIDNYQCSSLDQSFLCDDGICKNVTSVFRCHMNESVDTYDCTDRKNCIEMTGLFKCQRGVCEQMKPPWGCERVCEDIDLRGNVIVREGDTFVVANCSRGHDADNGMLIWDEFYVQNYTLVTSCTSVQVSEDGKNMSGQDCINGTALSKSLLSAPTNLTSVTALLLQESYANKLDPTNKTLPFDLDITLIQKTKLKVNDQGCVNTLQKECTTWLDKHARDGSNDTAKARFPCYVMHNNTEFVVARHNLLATKKLFMLMFGIPVGLWTGSCFCVYFISCCIRIDDWGHFRVKITSRDPPSIRKPKPAWGEDEKDEQAKAIEMQKLIKH